MNYSTDKAITSKDDDLLGRATFSNQLGKAICEYVGDDSLVIGLFGKWGSGKTSIVNMTIQTIEKHNEEIPEDAKSIIIRFAPWNYLGNSCLIKLFFDELMTTVNSDENSELKKKIGDVLKKYAGIFDAFTLLPAGGTALAAGFKTAANAGGEILSKPVDLNNTKKKLNDALRDIRQRIVVVIDDIDRLTNEQIRDIFQLVKQVADFPNIIYILVMDRDIVSKALSDVSGCDGNEYLNKIVQIPFEVPALRKSRINEIFIEQFNSIICEHTKDYDIDKQHFNGIFKYCIEPYISTLRDVNRILNVFQFKLGVMIEEFSLEDLIGITTIEVAKPELYKWIASNKQILCPDNIDIMSPGTSPKEMREFYENEFKQLGLDADITFSSIETLFPLSRILYTDNKSFSFLPSLDERREMRINNANRFDLFFAFDLDMLAVPRAIVNSCAYLYDKEQVTATISEMLREGKIAYFFEELWTVSNNLSVERLCFLISVFIDYYCEHENDIKDDERYSTFAFVDFNFTLMNLLTEEVLFDLLNEKLNNCDRYSIIGLSSFISPLGWTRYIKSKQNPLSDTSIGLLEKTYVERAKDLYKDDKILTLSTFSLFMKLWLAVDKVAANQFIQSYSKSNLKKLKLLCAFAERWRRDDGKGWYFDSENLAYIFSKDDVVQIVRKFKPIYIDRYSDEEQIKIATLYLLVARGRLGMESGNNASIDEIMAQELLVEWKSKNPSTVTENKQ